MKLNQYSEIPRRKISDRLRTARAFGFEVVDDFDPLGDTETANSPWALISKAVLNRDSYSCRVCGKSNFTDVEGPSMARRVRLDVEVHHIVPRKQDGVDSFRNLITLCSECHKRTFKNRYRGLPRRESMLTSYGTRLLVGIPRAESTKTYQQRLCSIEELARTFDPSTGRYSVVEMEGGLMEVSAAEVEFAEFDTFTAIFEKEFGATSYVTFRCKCPGHTVIRLFADREHNIIA